MSFSNHSFSEPNFKRRMLKDFLLDDSNSFYSTGFDSISSNHTDSRIQTLIQNDLDSIKLFRSRSATTTTKSAFQAIINAVKNFQFIAVKSPSIFPRSISRKLSSRKSGNSNSNITEIENKLDSEFKITVTIKDIIRWKSFRDLVEEKSPPLDFASSPLHYTTTTTTATTTTTPCSSKGSSWCDSDFTAEYSPFWNGNNDSGEKEEGKKYLLCVGEDLTGEEATKEAEPKVGPKVEENQLNSPISVIGVEFDGDGDGEETETNTINEDDNEDDDEEIRVVEEKAWHLLDYFKQTSSVEDINLDRLVLDFFREELTKTSDNEMLVRRVNEWINGENRLWIELEKKEFCIRDMEKDGKWRNFEDEKEKVSSVIENWMMSLLIEDLLLDLSH